MPLQDGLEHREQDTKVSGTRVKAVLKLLSQEAGFLVDPGVKVKTNGANRDTSCFVSFCDEQS